MKCFIQWMLLSTMLSTNAAWSLTNLNPPDAMETYEKDINKTEVLNVTRELTQLMIEKKIAEIAQILDPHFTLTHITGYVQPKEEWLSEIESERMKYYACEAVKTSIEINGNKVTFIGQNILDARIWGTRNKWRLQQTMLLEERNGKWIILNSVATTF